jgi:hypothetical protein
MVNSDASPTRRATRKPWPRSAAMRRPSGPGPDLAGVSVSPCRIEGGHQVAVLPGGQERELSGTCCASAAARCRAGSGRARRRPGPDAGRRPSRAGAGRLVPAYVAQGRGDSTRRCPADGRSRRLAGPMTARRILTAIIASRWTLERRWRSWRRAALQAPWTWLCSVTGIAWPGTGAGIMTRLRASVWASSLSGHCCGPRPGFQR